MKKKKVSEQEDVVLMANAERGSSKSSPISKRIINNILVEECALPNVTLLTRLSLRPHVAQPLPASKLRSLILLDRLRDFVVVPSSAGGNSSFELHSQSTEERTTLDRYHHFYGHSGMCA
jgi:hypothetical protein